VNEEKAKLSGPDLTEGADLSTVPDGTMLLGHVRGEPVLLARRGDELFAIGALCTHYGAPLEQGLLVGDTVRCPWHHACFSLRTGEALRAPALDPVSRWQVEEMHDLARQSTPVETRPGVVYVREKLERAQIDNRGRCQPARRGPSLSSVAARPAMPPRKRFVTRATPAASQC
jgi:apoptosis-inducing factor 3